MTSTLTPNAASTAQSEKESLEASVFRLKLQWMMAKDDAEKRKISEEIRRRIGSTPKQ